MYKKRVLTHIRNMLQKVESWTPSPITQFPMMTKVQLVGKREREREGEREGESVCARERVCVCACVCVSE